jgi:tetratricopeptide (TPR) repeat protein
MSTKKRKPKIAAESVDGNEPESPGPAKRRQPRRRSKKAREEGAALSNLGQMALQQGDLTKAEDYFQQSLLILRQAQDRQGEGTVLAYLGAAAQARGGLDEAEEYYQQGLALARATQDTLSEQNMLAALDALAKLRERLAEIELDAPASDKRVVAHALEAFLNTNSWDETRTVLCYAKKLLLADSADELLTSYMVQALRQNNQQELDTLNQHRGLLRLARIAGIDDAWVEFRAALLAPPEAPPAPSAPPAPPAPEKEEASHERTLEEAERELVEQIHRLFEAERGEASRQAAPQPSPEQPAQAGHERTLEEAERELEEQIRQLFEAERDKPEGQEK